MRALPPSATSSASALAPPASVPRPLWLAIITAAHRWAAAVPLGRFAPHTEAAKFLEMKKAMQAKADRLQAYG